MIIQSRRTAAGVLMLAALTTPFAVTAADASVAPKHYRNCLALNKVYPHGVGRLGARDKTSGQRVTNFTVNTKVYTYNDGPRNKATGEYDLDRDNDGIACEKR